MKPEVGIYIHVPFCVRKCNYCDFLSFSSAKEERDSYEEILLREFEHAQKLLSTHLPSGIYFGGGTPSLLSDSFYQKITEFFTKVWGDYWKTKEVTIEVNPGTITAEKAEHYHKLGINRISMGLQSACEKELKLLGRIHTYEEFLAGYQLIRDAGFKNVNVDVMSGIPGQTLESYLKTLSQVMELKPEHISSYSLILEEGTPFYRWYEDENYKEQNLPPLPSEELDRRMYEKTKEFLKMQGYERYEISNYAKKGCEAVHNSNYWKRKPYLGFGLGASSFYQEWRFKNPSDMESYKRLTEEEINDEKEFIHKRTEKELIDREDAMAEFMFLGLRMMSGISVQEFEQTFKMPLETVYGNVIAEGKREGLLEQNGDYIFLTDYGIDVSNEVMYRFLPDRE